MYKVKLTQEQFNTILTALKKENASYKGSGSNAERMIDDAINAVMQFEIVRE